MENMKLYYVLILLFCNTTNLLTQCIEKSSGYEVMDYLCENKLFRENSQKVLHEALDKLSVFENPCRSKHKISRLKIIDLMLNIYEIERDYRAGVHIDRMIADSMMLIYSVEELKSKGNAFYDSIHVFISDYKSNQYETQIENKIIRDTPVLYNGGPLTVNYGFTYNIYSLPISLLHETKSIQGKTLLSTMKLFLNSKLITKNEYELVIEKYESGIHMNESLALSYISNYMKKIKAD